MSRKNIKRFSPGFAIVLWIGSLFHRCYYRKFTVLNRHVLPRKQPVIFAANHQNAFMDPLAIIFAARRQIVFMARADIFKKKWIARLLYFIKILPVYRIRDGFFSVDQNKEVFKEITAVLSAGKPAALFPEGDFIGQKRLRPLKKGAARLALLAKEAIGPEREIFIVPTGIDYSNYNKPGADLLVIFGEPIPSSKYHEMYIEDPVRAVNELTRDLAKAMDKAMINIQEEEDYQILFHAINMYAPIELKKQDLTHSQINQFKVKKELSEKINKNITDKKKQISSLKEELIPYLDLLKNYNIRDTQILHPIKNSAYLILRFCLSLLLFPVHLYGMALNYLPYRLPVFLTRNMKDHRFFGSFRFGIGLILFFFYYLLILIICFIIFSKILPSLLLILSVPLTGLFAFYHYLYLLKMYADYRWLMIRIKKKEVYEDVLNRRKAIILKIEELLD